MILTDGFCSPGLWRGHAGSGRCAGSLRCAFGHAVRGARGDRTGNPRPGFAATEEAEHATLDFQLIAADRLDLGTVGLAVLGVIDLTFPLIVALRLLHVEQDRHAERRPVLL